jgi:hypothetical protein
MEIIRFDVWVLQQVYLQVLAKLVVHTIYHVLVPESAQFFQKQQIKRLLQ